MSAAWAMPSATRKTANVLKLRLIYIFKLLYLNEEAGGLPASR
jgi:hypothetical protein